MGAISIMKFLGEAPKLDPELLPNSAAQIASNVKLYSGDLRPYNQSSLQQALPKTGPITSIYPLDNGSGGYYWMHWNTDVDAVRAPVPNNAVGGTNDQRTYYSGDTTGNGELKSTTATMARAGVGTAYPYTYYTLGLPAPLTAPTIAATPFSPITLSTQPTRSAGALITVTTPSAHGLNSGAYVTVSGATGDTSFNVTNAQITVTGSTTFTYYASGSTATAVGTIVVNLAGLSTARTYVYTWLTAWGEESAPSPVSNTQFVYEGQSLSITGLPATFPTTGAYAGGVYQTVGMVLNIYRTVSSTTGTTYYLSGSVNLGTTSFTDNQPLTALVTQLPSTSWYPPSATLRGIRAVHNGILVGFFGTTVCFSEPGQPHSWPTKYYQEIGRTVVAVANVGTTIVVLTDSNPWVIQGNTPAVMQKVRLDTNMPCTSKRSVVNMDWGLCYATRGGIAVFSLYQGASLPTSYVYDWDNFRTIVDPTTITAVRYNNKYMAQHSQGMFIFEKDDHTGGFLTETNQATTALYYVPNTAQVYFAQGTPASLYLWDDPTQPFLQFQWKSKVFRTKDYLNVGAARVIADFSGGNAVTNANTTILANNLSYITNHITAGPLAGSGTRFQASLTGTQVDIGGALAQVPVAGSRIQRLLPTSTALTMYFYVNGTLASTASIVNDVPFRLPTGYRVDKFEVQLIGNAPVRQVQLGETPMSLRAV
jgi:hypothetical protein